MNKVKNIWVITDQSEAFPEYCTGAHTLGDAVTLVYAGLRDSAACADRAYYLGPLDSEHRWIGYIQKIISLVKENAPDIILFGSSKNCRLTAGLLGAALKTGVITDAIDVSIDDGVVASRMVYGGAAIRTEKATGAIALVCINNGVFQAGEKTAVAEIIDACGETADNGAECISVSKKETFEVRLATADKILCVGNGIEDEEGLDLARAIAKAMGAEMGCTRPVAEMLKLMPRETYIGVSGVVTKPELYVALGISGQVQHMVGCNKSGTIVAINKDESAPIFSSCDYGVVGDLKKVLPILIGMMRN